MKLRTGLFVLAVAVVAAWVLPSVRTESQRTAHEFLTAPAHVFASSHDHARVEPIQLALLFQTTGR